MAGRSRVRAKRLDEDPIVNAALKVAQNGLDNLTMRSVSDELQVSVCALYMHVAGREALKALVVEKILNQGPRVSPEAGDGPQAMVDLYPGLDRIVIAHSPNFWKANEIRREGITTRRAEGLDVLRRHNCVTAVEGV